MATVTIHEAKTNLCRLIARAEVGEEIVIARGKEPVVRLAPLKPKAEPRKSGWLKGIPELPASFFSILCRRTNCGCGRDTAPIRWVNHLPARRRETPRRKTDP